MISTLLDMFLWFWLGLFVAGLVVVLVETTVFLATYRDGEEDS